MIEVNPKKLVQVRCKNTVFIKKSGEGFICNNLLAEVEEGTGMIVCRKCKHKNFFDVRTPESRQWYNNKEKGRDLHNSTLRVQN